MNIVHGIKQAKYYFEVWGKWKNFVKKNVKMIFYLK